MKNIKKFISTLLIVALVLGAFPTAGFASAKTPQFDFCKIDKCEINCCEYKCLDSAKKSSISMLNNLACFAPSKQVVCLLNKGVAAINTAKIINGVNLTLSKYYKAIVIQQFKECKKLSVAKSCAENGLKALAGCEPSDAVKALLDQALVNIAKAHSIYEVNAIFANAFKTISEQIAKEACEANLDAAKDAAIAKLIAAAGENPSDELQAILNRAIADVSKATNFHCVQAALEAGLKAINKQLAKEAYEANLDAAKKDAIDKLIAAAGENPSDELQAILDEAIANVNNATNFHCVQAALEAGLKAISEQLAKEELEAAKEAAIAELIAAAGENPSDELQAILDEAIANVNAATTLEEVQAALEAGLKAINEQLAKEDYAAKLAAAKEDAIKQLEEAAGDNPSDAVKKILAEAIANVNAATTLEEVQAALEAGLAAIKAQLEKEAVVPDTGDQDAMVLWFLLLMGAAVSATALKRREEN